MFVSEHHTMISSSYTCLIKQSMVIKATFIETNCKLTLHTILYYLETSEQLFFWRIQALPQTSYSYNNFVRQVRGQVSSLPFYKEKLGTERLRKLPKDTEQIGNRALTKLQGSGLSFRAHSEFSKAIRSQKSFSSCNLLKVPAI